MPLEDITDFLTVVVTREEVDNGDFTAVNTLKGLLASADTVRAFKERVDVGFHGYDNDPNELFEIQSVRQFVQKLDEQFPYWLYFLSKHCLGLQCISYCFLPPFLNEQGRARIYPEKIQALMMNRWLPALEQICGMVGDSEDEFQEIMERSIKYVTEGRQKPTD